jgi:hypothetical protein
VALAGVSAADVARRGIDRKYARRIRPSQAPGSHRPLGGRRALVATLVAGALLGACGEDPADQGVAAGQVTSTTTAASPVTTTAAAAARNVTSELTTADGYRYRISLVVNGPSATGRAGECPGTATPGKSYLPVTLTVANAATDRSAPFPPVRIEMATTSGAAPARVLVLDGSGACTFSPRIPSLGPGGSAVFNGTSPAIDQAAATGSAGKIEVKVSETTFSLTVPVP